MAEKRGCGMNTQDENERRVKLALMLSAEMLKNGGETYRAEDCALRVLAAAGSADTQVMAMPTNILDRPLPLGARACGRSGGD